MSAVLAPSRPPFPAGRDVRLATPGFLRARGITLRPARDDDLPWLRTLYASTRTEELARVPWPDAAKRDFLDSQFALQHLHYLSHYDAADFLVIESDGIPLGRYYLHRGEPDYLIIDISIDPAARRQGIAGALIAQTQREAAGLGRGVQLHVQVDNPRAQRLYERLGFAAAEESGSHRRMRWAAGREG
ncbi:N-acetyltransferase [Pseudoxanthomonas sp. CF125]|uniref:GNAT family N-acetyltransferase n=1 Tax=Pseudoxanthomonas sp. CF125 TaxID=1855303 RepID=UPI00088259F4|nr:N-acetyltransferase [Pseudoxanthomonas sp. CF125]SDQ85317.1 Ribosomal protein S18 acetylase RimI [Pseudoxanthomonas sp. CF125]